MKEQESKSAEKTAKNNLLKKPPKIRTLSGLSSGVQQLVQEMKRKHQHKHKRKHNAGNRTTNTE